MPLIYVIPGFATAGFQLQVVGFSPLAFEAQPGLPAEL